VRFGTLVALLGLCFFSPCSFSKPAQNPADSQLPFDLRSEFLIVVEGRIGTLTHLKFLLDTGSTISIVSKKLARQSNLRLGPGTTTVTARGSEQTLMSSTLPELQIGSLRIMGHRFFVGEVAAISEFATDVDAVIGLDVLSRCETLEIDYARRTIHFVTSREHPSELPPTVRTFLVPATLQGHTINLLVDTGIRGVLLFADHLHRHVGRWESSERSPVLLGTMRVDRLRLASLWLGQEQITDAVFVVPDSRSLLPDVMDGLIGPLALKGSWFALNFKNMTLRYH
jgi:hypothetical protein